MSAGEPSQLFLDHLPELREAASLGLVVDLACGRGRHALALARAGVPVLGVDRNPDSLDQLRAVQQEEDLALTVLRADLETGQPIPLPEGRCGAILVFRYLHRPIADELTDALAPGGLLLYETFTVHQRELGYGPSRDEFLLEAGELPTLFPRLQVSHHWEGRVEHPKQAWVAQLVARRRV